jgi:hypothetical protein
MSLADEFAAIAKAAFIAGALSETGKIAKKAGKATVRVTADTTVKAAKKVKRKASAYSIRYGRMFRKVAPRFKKKNGSWKTNGFKNAQKAAHKLAKK